MNGAKQELINTIISLDENTISEIWNVIKKDKDKKRTALEWLIDFIENGEAWPEDFDFDNIKSFSEVI